MPGGDPHPGQTGWDSFISSNSAPHSKQRIDSYSALSLNRTTRLIQKSRIERDWPVNTCFFSSSYWRREEDHVAAIISVRSGVRQERRESYHPSASRLIPDSTRLQNWQETEKRKSSSSTHHYGASYPSARVRFSLFTEGRLVGVVVFSHPVQRLGSDRGVSSQPLGELGVGKVCAARRRAGKWREQVLAREPSSACSGKVWQALSLATMIASHNLETTIMHRGHAGIYYQATASDLSGADEYRTVRLAFLLYHRRLIAARSCTRGQAGKCATLLSVENRKRARSASRLLEN